MAYSLLELHSRDLDIFLRDSIKPIHFASAGGLIPEKIRDSDVYNNIIIDSLSQGDSAFDIEINPNLRSLLGLSQDDISLYLTSFVEVARKGFFTYDKTRLGDFEDQTYHLVAKPKKIISYSQLISLYTGLNDAIVAQQDFPVDFEIFDISEFI